MYLLLWICICMVVFSNCLARVCVFGCGSVIFFFFKQKTAYEMRISDWSSDVCSSDLFRSSRKSGTCTIMPCGKRPTDGEKSGARSSKIGRASCRERVCQYV